MKLLPVYLLLITSLSYLDVYSQKKVRIGIIEYKSQEKVEQTFTPILEHVAEQIGSKAELEIVDENDLGFRLNRGDFDIGIFTVFPYLKAKIDFPDLSVFATHLVQGKEYFNGYILTKPEIGNFSDLKESKLLFVKESSTSGFKIPNGILTENNIDIEAGYLSYAFSGDHTASLWALDSGLVDAVAVDNRLKKFKGPNKGKFKVLSEFVVPYHAYVFAPGLTAERKEELKNVLFNAHKDPQARSLFNNPLDVTQFIPKDDNYYNELRRYMRIVRVKPSIVVGINPTENALEKLGNRDVILLLEGRIQQELQKSHRFGDVFIEEGDAIYKCIVELFSTEEGIFNYQVKLNDRFIGDGEIISEDFRKRMPVEFSQWLLKSLPVTSELLFNGEDWFITYGTDDGITTSDYQFDIILPNGRGILIKKDDIQTTTALNIFFKQNDNFAKGCTVVITYKVPIGQLSLLSSGDEEDTDTYNVFSKAFWSGTGIWDKIGLIGGILFALASAIIGKFLTDRTKQRFKNILYQTNDLIKEYVEDHYKLETRLLKQKDFISQALEEGKINENQFLILKNRIEDMQALIEFQHQKGDINLAGHQADEIRDIVSGDEKITEREFSRIMSIIKKSSATAPTTGQN